MEKTMKPYYTAKLIHRQTGEVRYYRTEKTRDLAHMRMKLAGLWKRGASK
jgi:hypothetical protein